MSYRNISFKLEDGSTYNAKKLDRELSDFIKGNFNLSKLVDIIGEPTQNENEPHYNELDLIEMYTMVVGGCRKCLKNSPDVIPHEVKNYFYRVEDYAIEFILFDLGYAQDNQPKEQKELFEKHIQHFPKLYEKREEAKKLVDKI